MHDSDFNILYHHLKTHPRLLTLDLGDCDLGDEGIELICSLIKESKDLHGLHNLTLSHNPKISSDGWTKFSMALASGSCLRSLEIDYNDIGDSAGTCIVIALPGASHLETLDMECTGITDKTGQILYHLIKSYNLKLKDINLDKTKVLESTKEAIIMHISDKNANKRPENLSDDECSLAMSEPPISEDGDTGLVIETLDIQSKSSTATTGNITHKENCDVPIVEVSPAMKPNIIKTNSEQAEEITNKDDTQSLVIMNADRSNINAAGFEIKKAFSLNDLTNPENENENKIDGNEEDKERKYVEEYEAYIPEKESLKHTDSNSTLVESMDAINDFGDDLEKSESIYSVKGLQETDDTSKSGNPSPLFYARPMSAPMSGNDRLNVESGLLQAKSKETAPKDLTTIIRQKQDSSTEVTKVMDKQRPSDIEIQELN